MAKFKVAQVNGDTGRDRAAKVVSENQVERTRQQIREVTRSTPAYSSDYVRVTNA